MKRKEGVSVSFLGGKNASELEALVESVVLEQYDHYYRLAYSYVGQETDAYDIVQNSAYKALKNAHSLRNPQFVKTWVYRIVLNEIFATLKGKKADSYERLQEQLGNEVESLENLYEGIDLKVAIDGLSEQEKAIILLKYFEGFKLEEISDILDENVNTVKSRLYRSMKKLRIKLDTE